MKKQDELPDALFSYLRDILYYPAQADLNVEELPEEWRTFGNGLAFLGHCLKENSVFATALAHGDLACAPPSVENVISAPLKRLQGDLRHLTWVTKQVAAGDYGQRVDYLGEFSDAFNSMVEQLRRQREQLEKLAYTDELTGACNRQYAYGLLKTLWESGEAFTVAFIDIDSLKLCNDSFGHDEGDRYLLLACRYLQSVCGEQDALCRMGGDEFVIIDRSRSEVQLAAALEQVRREFSLNDRVPPQFSHSFSYGCVEMSSGSGMTYSDLLKKADEKMYRYKSEHSVRRRSCPDPGPLGQEES